MKRTVRVLASASASLQNCNLPSYAWNRWLASFVNSQAAHGSTPQALVYTRHGDPASVLELREEQLKEPGLDEFQGIMLGVSGGCLGDSCT